MLFCYLSSWPCTLFGCIISIFSSTSRQNCFPLFVSFTDKSISNWYFVFLVIGKISCIYMKSIILKLAELMTGARGDKSSIDHVSFWIEIYSMLLFWLRLWYKMTTQYTSWTLNMSGAEFIKSNFLLLVGPRSNFSVLLLQTLLCERLYDHGVKEERRCLVKCFGRIKKRRKEEKRWLVVKRGAGVLPILSWYWNVNYIVPLNKKWQQNEHLNIVSSSTSLRLGISQYLLDKIRLSVDDITVLYFNS